MWYRQRLTLKHFKILNRIPGLYCCRQFKRCEHWLFFDRVLVTVTAAKNNQRKSSWIANYEKKSLLESHKLLVAFEILLSSNFPG